MLMVLWKRVFLLLSDAAKAELCINRSVGVVVCAFLAYPLGDFSVLLFTVPGKVYLMRESSLMFSMVTKGVMLEFAEITEELKAVALMLLLTPAFCSSAMLLL